MACPSKYASHIPQVNLKCKWADTDCLQNQAEPWHKCHVWMRLYMFAHLLRWLAVTTIQWDECFARTDEQTLEVSCRRSDAIWMKSQWWWRYNYGSPRNLPSLDGAGSRAWTHIIMKRWKILTLTRGITTFKNKTKTRQQAPLEGPPKIPSSCIGPIPFCPS